MTTEHVTLIPTVRIFRTRFFEKDVWEGDYPRDNVTTEDYVCEAPDTVEEAVRVFQREGLSFDATGTEWAANPDGTTIVDYATAEREEVSGHFIGFSDADMLAVIERVG